MVGSTTEFQKYLIFYPLYKMHYFTPMGGDCFFLSLSLPMWGGNTDRCIILGTNFSPIRTPGEIMSFGVSPVNYSEHIHTYCANIKTTFI